MEDGTNNIAGCHADDAFQYADTGAVDVRAFDRRSACVRRATTSLSGRQLTLKPFG